MIGEAKDDIAEKVKKIVKKCMELAMERIAPGVPFKVEPEVRKTWGKPSDALPI